MTGFRTALIGLATLAGVATSIGAQQRSRVDERQSRAIDTTFAFDASGSIDLGIVSGTIKVTAWARGDARVNARIAGEGTIAHTLSSSRISLDARPARGRGEGDAHYEIMVPVGTRVTARSVSGDISVSGTRAELKLSSVSGKIDASESRDRAEANTVSGRLTLQRMEGTSSASTVSGAVSVSEIQGELDLSTVSGRVRVDRGDLTRLRIKTMSGAVDYSGTLKSSGRHEVTTHSGHVTLHFPSSFGASVDMETFSGRLNSGDFAVTLQPGNTGSRTSRRTQFDLGGGGVRLTINTFSGGLTLRKTDARQED